MGVNIGGPETGSRERRGNVVVKTSVTRTRDGCGCKKRRGLSRQKYELVRKRKHIIEASAGTHRHFAVAERIPGKADTRLKIFSSGIAEKGITQMGGGVCNVSQDGKLAGGFCGNGSHLITKAEIKREV